tara:strand:+ start:8929 stop:9150 length:222 start_codon:yes stop_codon:yes gene_type:complete
MTKFKALFIKLLRIKYDYSWRSIAREVDTRYNLKKPFNSTFYTLEANSNQIDGIIYCNQAMEYLNEKIEDGWN